MLKCTADRSSDEAEDEQEDESVDKRLWLLSGIILRRHSTIGAGLHYSASELNTMWTTSPQIITGVHVVETVAEAGVNTVTTSRISERGLSYSHTPHARTRMDVCLGGYGTKADRLSKKLSTDVNKRREKDVIERESSRAFPCTNPLCCRVFLSEKIFVYIWIQTSASLVCSASARLRNPCPRTELPIGWMS